MIVRMKNTFRMLLAAMLLSLFALPGYSWQKSFPEKDYVAICSLISLGIVAMKKLCAML